MTEQRDSHDDDIAPTDDFDPERVARETLTGDIRDFMLDRLKSRMLPVKGSSFGRRGGPLRR